jgi:hypothetical protein
LPALEFFFHLGNSRFVQNPWLDPSDLDNLPYFVNLSSDQIKAHRFDDHKLDFVVRDTCGLADSVETHLSVIFWEGENKLSEGSYFNFIFENL